MQQSPMLIALDLDGSLLTTDKRLTARTRAVLEKASAAGVRIVPATGRFFLGLPEEIRTAPFLRYAITINGASVLDRDAVVYRAEIPWQRAVEIMAYLDPMDLIYDCYQDSWGWITRDFQERAAEFVPDQYYLKMLRVFRSPVDELKAHLSDVKHGVQKIILFTRTDELQAELLRTLPVRFPDLAVTSSSRHNIELNAPRANKGDALRGLAAALDIPAERTMAVGDGLNDMTMLRAAGIRVAMGNAHPDLKAIATYITDDCDHDGAAKAVELFCGLS